jgi:hypothetical protein
LITRIIFGGEYRSWSSSLCSCLIGSNFLFSTVSSKYLHSTFSSHFKS